MKARSFFWEIFLLEKAAICVFLFLHYKSFFISLAKVPVFMFRYL